MGKKKSSVEGYIDIYWMIPFIPTLRTVESMTVGDLGNRFARFMMIATAELKRVLCNVYDVRKSGTIVGPLDWRLGKSFLGSSS